MPFKYPSMQERILANSVISDEFAFDGTACWIWTGKVCISPARHPLKYGVLNVRFKRGPRKGKVKSMLAHRVALIAFKGRRLTSRMVARHLCSNSLCCNPDHLAGGTQRTNNRDTVRAGRHASCAAVGGER